MSKSCPLKTEESRGQTEEIRGFFLGGVNFVWEDLNLNFPANPKDPQLIVIEQGYDKPFMTS